ncbi:sulfite exporter TauE/SafE family protein [Massilia pinisoli]|uniref:Probable membrane transporter protein n=1 Tax=Massilia pinisoli TaxID=1772194 RepID=A0ABT1ZW35_9BURK|nr:sulfite exporter TauE/SafE family protein [Massilia pinisoli]MCS0584157.1 sulfite exporter TauE/SafE family protein [Massilia pinisoli]
MPPSASLALTSIAIGILVGAAGIGGFFLPPALTLLIALDLHRAMALSLSTFVFTGIAGALYFHRKGSLDWTLARPVCLGAAPAGYAGAWLGRGLDTGTLSALLAALILAVGIQTLAGRAAGAPSRDARGRGAILVAIGIVTGFLSGLTGVGGPVLSVPLMVMCGYPVLTAIGVGQVLQTVGALSGSLANLHYAGIDYGLAAFIGAFETVGVLGGAVAIHRMDAGLVKRLVGGLCMVAGCGFILRSL